MEACLGVAQYRAQPLQEENKMLLQIVYIVMWQANDHLKFLFYRRKFEHDKNDKNFLATDVLPQERLFTLSVLLNKDGKDNHVVVSKLCTTHRGQPQSRLFLLSSTTTGC